MARKEDRNLFEYVLNGKIYMERYNLLDLMQIMIQR